MIRYVWWIILCSLFLHANDVTRKYTSYRYVMDEFDIDPSYADNIYFRMFVKKNEKRMYHFYVQTARTREELIDLIRRKLLEDDFSDMFLYLSMIESGLKVNAVSVKKAVGLWQFMPKTASDYHLDIYGYIDQRCDPVCATEAAIKHLRRLHMRFGKWYLAVLAYNCGEGRLSRAIEKAGTDDLEVLINPQNHYLPNETIRYIQKILLIAMIGEKGTVSFSDDMDGGNDLVEVEVKGGSSLSRVAKFLEMPADKLLKLNPAYIQGIVPKGTQRYSILIPEAKIANFYLKYVPHEDEVKSKPYLVSHKVILGETLKEIAKTYGTTVEQIRQSNRIENGFLEVNTTLVIPVDKEMFDRLLEE